MEMRQKKSMELFQAKTKAEHAEELKRKLEEVREY